MTMATASSVQREPSMEEILASIRRIIEDSDTVRHSEPDADQDAFGRASMPDNGEGDHFDAFRTGFDDAEPVSADLPAIEGTDAGEGLAHISADAPPHTAEIRPIRGDLNASGQMPPVEAAAQPVALSSGPAIISDHAGRQVAAAFGELSEAFAASRRRSFDEMAQEMLRPMLQDWLDNNLPTLVEKLVREEIERVARGG